MAKKFQRHLMTAVKVAVTLAMLAWVLWLVEWRDKLRLPDGTVAQGRFVPATAGETDVRGWLVDGATRHPVPRAGAADAVDPYQPGFVNLVRGVGKKQLLLGALLLPLTGLILAVRWRWLLRTHGLDVGLLEILRLTWVGLFMNNVLPSSIGGDGVKAFCIARRSPGQRVDAMMTVLVDRALGLVSLLAVGGIAVLLGRLSWLPNPDNPKDRLWMLPWGVFGALLAILLGAFVFFSGRFREKLGIPKLLARLPGGRHIALVDRALFHFRGHPWTMAKCVALSMGLHLVSVSAIALIGGALGMRATQLHYYMFVPLVFVGSAFIPSIGGLGVQESAFAFLFTRPFVGDTAAQAVALSLLYRMLQMLMTLPGSLWAFREMNRLKHAPQDAPPAPAALPASAN